MEEKVGQFIDDILTLTLGWYFVFAVAVLFAIEFQIALPFVSHPFIVGVVAANVVMVPVATVWIISILRRK